MGCNHFVEARISFEFLQVSFIIVIWFLKLRDCGEASVFYVLVGFQVFAFPEVAGFLPDTSGNFRKRKRCTVLKLVYTLVR